MGWVRRADVRAAAVVGVVQVGGTALAARDQPDARAYGVGAALLLAASAAALLVRTARPVAALAGAAVPVWAYLALGYPGGPIAVAVVVAVLSAIAAGHRVAAWTALALGYAGFLVAPLAGGRGLPPPAAWGAVAAWTVAIGAAAELARSRRERAAEAARTRAEEGRRRAGEQRMAIARELHDVLAHHISLISVQAGVALHLLDERPEQARTALTAIRQASKESLGELRSALELLRHGEEGAPRAPAPGLDALDGLVARTAAAGLPVTVEVTGTPRPVPAAVGLAAYRIVQEALTNVTRHAGPAAAVVRLGYGPRELAVEVTDDGTGGRAGGSGSGLLGMAERAAALGGTVEAGPRPTGGFRVAAHLPADPVDAVPGATRAPDPAAGPAPTPTPGTPPPAGSATTPAAAGGGA